MNVTTQLISWTNLLRSPGGATWSVLGVGGAPSGFFFFGGAAAWSGLYSWWRQCEQTHESRMNDKLEIEIRGFIQNVLFIYWIFGLEVLCFYLKCRPVHVHLWAVVVAEPLQVLLCVCSQDRALQFSVYCGITEERKMEQIETMKLPEGTSGRCQSGNRRQSVAQILVWKRSSVWSSKNGSVSLNSLKSISSK